MKEFDKLHNTVFIDKELHNKYMDLKPFDIVESLVLWSLLSNKRNISNLKSDPIEIKQYLNEIGFMKVCPPSIFSKYYSFNFINKLDHKLISASFTNHSHSNFVLNRCLQIFEFLHWRLLNNNYVQHVHGGDAQKRSKSQLQMEMDDVLSISALKTLRYLRIDWLYLTLYDIALHEIASVPLSYSILTSWIDHGFHLFIAANPGHLKINKAANPLHEMYINALYHIVSDKPRFVDIKKEYGKTLDIHRHTQPLNDNNTFLFNKIFYHILGYFGVGNTTSIINKVLLRCILFDRHKYGKSDDAMSLHVFRDKKFTKAMNEILFVYGAHMEASIKDRLYIILIRYLASVGEIDHAQYIYNMAAKHNYFGVLNSAYNLIKICEALNTYIQNGLFECDDADQYLYFTIRVQQCIDLLSKMMKDRDKMLLSMAINEKHFENTSKKVHQLTDSQRMKLEQLTANHFFLDITSVTHRILYCLNQLNIAIKEFEIATKTHTAPLRFTYSEQLLSSLIFIERIHHKYPLSNDWSYLKLSEQKQMFLDIANGIRSGVLISIICEQNKHKVPRASAPTKIMRLRLLNHYGSLWHIIPFKDVLSSAIMTFDGIAFNTFLQSLNINILPHSDYKLATFFRICSLYLKNLSRQNELKTNDISLLCSKLINILEYAVGDVNENKSTSVDYFLLNIKLLALSIHDKQLKCMFLQNIYDKMVMNNDLIKQNKHFIPDLELCEMILFEWFLYFEQRYKSYKPDGDGDGDAHDTFKQLFIENNVMNDLLEYAISMQVFDDSNSHPLMFHLSIFCKLIHFMECNASCLYATKTDIMNVCHSVTNEEYHAAITNTISRIESVTHWDAYDPTIFDEIVGHLKQTWSPYYIQFEQNKKRKRMDKQSKRWKEMIEPQLMSVVSPQQMRFMDGASIDSLSVSHWFTQQKQAQNSNEVPFEEFVHSLDIQYLKQLMSYNKFVKSKRLEATLTVNDYITNLNEDGVYVDQSLQSFIHSIEPIIQRNINANDTIIHHSEAITFLHEIETVYNDLLCNQQEINEKKQQEITASRVQWKKKMFLQEIDALLNDKPTLQLFVDDVQQIINRNKHKLYKHKTYSLSPRYEKVKPRHINNDLNLDFSNWNEFEMNVAPQRQQQRKQQQHQQQRTLLAQLDDIESLFESNEMLGDLNYHKLQKFLESVQTLPIKSNMNQETYAMTKLVKDMDEMY